MADSELINFLRRQEFLRNKNIKLIQSVVLRILEKSSLQVLNQLDFNNLSQTLLEEFQIIASLPDALLQNGLTNLFQEIQETYLEELNLIQELLVISNLPSLADIDKTQIAVILEADFKSLQDKFTIYGNELGQALSRNILSGQAPDFNILTENLTTRTARNLITEYDTALSGLVTTVNVKKAQEVFDNPKFEYVGANDKLTRSFCQNHIGKVYTLEQIKALDNGQGLDVLTYRGGYNCRHFWAVVDDEQN